MDKLPKVYANPIEKEINNNKEIFYSNLRQERTINKESIYRQINEIFANMHHVYKSKVELKIDGVIKEEVIVGKTNNYLLTLDGKKINMAKIEEIRRI